jgi:diguanylate cyclase (GGDEF)-like protein/PAS domain S-box-containing protein
MASPTSLSCSLESEFQLLFEATPIPYLVLTPDFTIVAANEARLRVTNTAREQILGRDLFEAFPDNPDDPDATSVRNLRASLMRVIRSKLPDAMPIQKYDIPVQGSPEGVFEVRYWKPLNTPVLDPTGELVYIIHQVEDVTAQILERQAVEESEARFRQMADAMPQVVWSTLPDGYHDYFNKQWYDFTGLPEGSTHGEEWGKVYHPEDQERAWKVWRHSLATGEPFEIQYRLRHHSGQYRWVLGRALPVRNDAGEIERWMGTYTDIHEQKLAEEARVNTESKLKKIVESDLIGIVEYSLDGTLMKVNDYFLKMLGYTRQDFEQHGLDWRELTPPEWEQADKRAGEELLSSGVMKPYEKEYFRKDGSRLPVWIGAAHLDASQNEGIAYILDISQLKNAQLEVQESEIRFRTLADNIPQLAWMADSDGSIFWYNNRWFEYTGTTLEEMRGWGWTRVQHPDHVEAVKAKYCHHIVEHAGEWEDTFPLRGTDGNYRWFLSRAVPIRDQNGQIVRWFGTNTDVTYLRQAEEALRLSEEKFRTTFEYAPVGIAEWTVDGRFITANPKLFDMLGYTREEFEKLSIMDVTHPADMEAKSANLQKLIRGEADVYIMEKRYVRKDKSFVWVSVTTSIRHPEGKPPYIIAIIEDVTARKKAEEEISRALERSYHIANHDTLTGLANRANFNDRLKDALHYAQRDNHLVAVHFLDLDRFKSINDTLGHHIGDLLLKEVARRIKSHVRATDLVARFGGDEFVIIQTHLTDPAAAEVLAEKIVEEVGHPYLLEGNEIRSGTSIGIALYPNDAEEPELLVKCADLALYEAKNRGRYNYQVYREGMGAVVKQAQKIEQELRRALREDEFILHYQPEFDLESGRITGIEALIRWQHPEKGLLAASEFIHDAENANLIPPIGEWALRTACLQHKDWIDAGLAVPLTLNISFKQLRHFHFLQVLKRTIEETKLPPSSLQLEIRESALLDPRFSTTLLKELKSNGLNLALDDFGTELTALSSLHKFPLDVVKPSKELVKELPNQTREATILAAIIGVAHDGKIAVCAGGVETPDQLAAVKDLGCDSAQGYFLSLPLEAVAMSRLVKTELVH